MTRARLQGRVQSLLWGAAPSLLALVLGFLAASVLMVFAGSNPAVVFRQMFTGALFTESGQSYVISYTSTLILTALAFLIPGKAGIWNVGAQGQIYLGGITAALIAVFIPMPPILWPLFGVLGACTMGALWAALPGVLEAYRNASAIVTTLMLNFVAGPLASFVLFNVIGPKVGNTVYTYSNVQFSASATIPGIPYFTASIMIFVSILAAVGSYYLLTRTTLGYNMRAAGLGPQPAEARGINPRTMKVLAMVIGGLLAGLAAAGDVLGPGHACTVNACYYDHFAEGAFGGEGFAGIAVALVAANNPIAAIFSATFFAILVSGASFIVSSSPQPAQAYIPWAMEGIIILFLAMPNLAKMILQRRRPKRT